LERFTGDAAHELRSPVAAIRAQAEVAVLHPDPELAEETLRSVATEAARLSELLSDLLALARADAGARPPATAVDMVAEARRAISRAELAAEADHLATLNSRGGDVNGAVTGLAPDAPDQDVVEGELSEAELDPASALATSAMAPPPAITLTAPVRVQAAASPGRWPWCWTICWQRAPLRPVPGLGVGAAGRTDGAAGGGRRRPGRPGGGPAPGVRPLHPAGGGPGRRERWGRPGVGAGHGVGDRPGRRGQDDREPGRRGPGGGALAGL